MRRYLSLALLAFSQLNFGQNTMQMQTPAQQLRALDELSTNTDYTDPQATKAFITTVLQNTSFRSLNSDAADRFVRNEMSFHAGSQEAVKEEHVVLAVNNVLSGLAVPGSNVVNQAQIRFIRLRLLPLLPHIMQSPDTTAGEIVSDSMTPAAALYLASFVILQKMTLPVWQQTPEQFMQTVQAESVQSPGKQSPTVSAYQVPSTAIVSFQSFKRDIADPSTDSAHSFHKFLDDLGFAK